MARFLVMLIDPVADDRELQTWVLRQAGYTVFDGTQQPFEAADTVRPDAIVLDVSPNRVGSKELIARLKRDSRTARIPVITVSAYPQAELFPTEGFVGKPNRPDVLVAELRRVLGG